MISFETSCIMNRLLQGVVFPGGTAEGAAVSGVAVVGKTGTGEMGNWFAGVTPKYSLAVRHGNGITSNNAEYLFSDIMSKLDQEKGALFPMSENVEMRSYCEQSGHLAGEKCDYTGMGYFLRTDGKIVCSIHK